MPLQLTIKQVEGKPGQVYYPLQLNEIPKPTPGQGQVLVKLQAAALNHRDLFIRQHLYPGISFKHPLWADGYGVVVETGLGCGEASEQLVGKPVLLTPMRGWESDPLAPEDSKKFTVVGGAQATDSGTAQEYVVVDEGEVVRAPEHLSPAEGAALPLVGITAWRALVTKSGNALPGRNILITGIGGGVALQALQFAAALGCNVYVTSGDADKIDKATQMGARGGVCYRDQDWDKQLAAMLPRDRPYIDAVIDGAGGDIMARTIRLIKAGGVIVSYGMTLGAKMDWLATAFLKNVELRGTSMGSKKEFREMVRFVSEKGIRPVVSRVARGGLDNLDEINALFDEMKAGRQFGKLVVLIDKEAGAWPYKL